MNVLVVMSLDGLERTERLDKGLLLGRPMLQFIEKSATGGLFAFLHQR